MKVYKGEGVWNEGKAGKIVKEEEWREKESNSEKFNAKEKEKKEKEKQIR